MSPGITRTHHRSVLQLRDATADRLMALWVATGGPGEAEQAAFVAGASPLVLGAQRTAAFLMTAYLAQLVGGRPARVDVDAVVQGARNGVAPAEVYARPTVTARALLSEGTSYAEAMRQARQRVGILAETDVMLANRGAAQAALEGDSRIVGYRRVLTGISCSFCAVASTKRYGSGDLMPIHARCDCDIAPVTDAGDPGLIINRDVLRKLQERGPDYWKRRGFVTAAGDPVDPVHAAELPVIVRQHGELGPVLAHPGDVFTSEGDRRT